MIAKGERKDKIKKKKEDTIEEVMNIVRIEVIKEYEMNEEDELLRELA